MDFDAVDMVNASMALQSSMLMQNVGTAVLANAIDTAQEMGEGMTRIMEQSVNPELGGNVDVRV